MKQKMIINISIIDEDADIELTGDKKNFFKNIMADDFNNKQTTISIIEDVDKKTSYNYLDDMRDDLFDAINNHVEDCKGSDKLKMKNKKELIQLIKEKEVELLNLKSELEGSNTRHKLGIVEFATESENNKGKK